MGVTKFLVKLKSKNLQHLSCSVIPIHVFIVSHLVRCNFLNWWLVFQSLNTLPLEMLETLLLLEGIKFNVWLAFGTSLTSTIFPCVPQSYCFPSFPRYP